jgi:hypothetical protein
MNCGEYPVSLVDFIRRLAVSCSESKWINDMPSVNPAPPAITKLPSASLQRADGVTPPMKRGAADSACLNQGCSQAFTSRQTRCFPAARAGSDNLLAS